MDIIRAIFSLTGGTFMAIAIISWWIIRIDVNVKEIKNHIREKEKE